MKFVYGGTTWSPSDSEYPNYPIALGEITDSDLRRTLIAGEARKHTNWSKPTFTFSWNNCGSSVRDHVKSWVDLDTDVTFYNKYGTTACKASAPSYSFEEKTLANYNGGIMLVGT